MRNLLFGSHKREQYIASLEKEFDEKDDQLMRLAMLRQLENSNLMSDKIRNNIQILAGIVLLQAIGAAIAVLTIVN